MKIEQIDKNLKVETTTQKENIKFYNCLEKPFEIFGLIKPTSKHPYFTRMDPDIAETVNDGVKQLNKNTAGGRVRFKTNSTYLAISAVMENPCKMPHIALTGSSGFDLYVDNLYKATFVPPYEIENGYDSIVEMGNSDIKDIIVNFPLYADVKELYIGLEEDALISKPERYINTKPIVYYGSSITQGGCASRPGMSYQSIISRRLNTDYINLGFSGSARAEDEISVYISNIDMSIFVYDYDHNAPNVDYLRKTHEKMFKKIRAAKPDIPIIMISRPKYILNEEEKERLEIIKNTYENAVRSGDKNVYFIKGPKLMELCGNDGTVDNCHPTDLGFFSIANILGDVIEKIIRY